MSKTSTIKLTRTFILFQENNSTPELADIPVNAAGGTQVAVFLMPLQPDPFRMQRSESGMHPMQTVHGITRSHDCRPVDVDQAAAVALFFTPDTIHIGIRRDDALWWAIRGRHPTAAEDGRANSTQFIAFPPGNRRVLLQNSVLAATLGRPSLHRCPDKHDLA